MKREPKCAFVCWNPFQVLQFANVYEQFTDACFIVIEQSSNLGFFDDPYIRSTPYQYRSIRPSEVVGLDGVFDLVFFQSPFPNMELLRAARLVAIQYGLAKERHNYGAWRALADLNFSYGDYSREKIEHFAPTQAVGNPKFDRWPDYQAGKVPAIDELRSRLETSKPTVLFMPTWGELGSFEALLPTMATLKAKYNVVLKVHHNDGQRRAGWRSQADHFGLVHQYDGGADQLALLSVADVVVSDFSGAIFDAIFARVPVVLFQESVDLKVGLQKFDLASLEFAERETLGVVCEHSAELGARVGWALAHRDEVVAKTEPLRERLFRTSETPAARQIYEQSLRLWRGELPALTPPQRYTREAVQELRKLHKAGRGADRASGLQVSSSTEAFVAALMLLLLTERYRRKLLDNPAAFFRDSRNFVMKQLGRGMGYGRK